MNPINRFRNFTAQSAVWPSLEYELTEAKNEGFLKGDILNAGAGRRDISHLVDGRLVNQDITWEGDDRTNIDIFSPIHSIPRPNNFFDNILCIAVLEHVENPEEVIPEFLRVLKPGGYVVASVPFLQPEHKIPTDFQRYTKDGLQRLFSLHGFEIVSVKPIFSVYHTIHWITYEWLHLRDTTFYKILRLLILPPLVFAAQKSRLQSDKLASVFQIVARKPVCSELP